MKEAKGVGQRKRRNQSAAHEEGWSGQEGMFSEGCRRAGSLRLSLAFVVALSELGIQSLAFLVHF